MRKPMAKKVLAATLAAAMTMSVVACAPKTPASTASTPASTPSVSTSEPEAPVEPYPVITDANGNPIDLGNMEITIRDWWSGDGAVSAPETEYDQAIADWREWAQEKYHFTVKQVGISDWGSAPADFAEYAAAPADENNYVFIVRDDPAFTSAVFSGLAYDLATLDCLDFSDAKFQYNGLHKTWTFGSSIYGMTTGYSEPRTGIYFNKKVLTDAKVDYNEIYKMAENGTWTWDAFYKICEQVQRDTDNDGVDDIYGITLNEGVMTELAPYTNSGTLIDKTADGKFRYALEDANTLEALNWVVKMFTAFDNHDPEGAAWDYYKEDFMSGKVAFMIEDVYAGYDNGYLQDMADKDQLGFVMFPAGPNGKSVNILSDNIICIPANYDADRAWKIAFAYNCWTDTPGLEAVNGYIQNCRKGLFDEESIAQIEKMMTADGIAAKYSNQVPSLNMGPDLTWKIGVGSDVSAVVEGIRDTWKGYVDAANALLAK